MAQHSQIPPVVAVYGASGHTGGFILDALARRGLEAIAIGRRTHTRGDTPVRIATLDDAEALRSAFAGCGVVINAAGPFLDTATPVVEAALAAGCHYIDVTAEQASARDTLQRHHQRARQRGRCVIPAAGFFGGLADLLASTLAPSRLGTIDHATVAVALDHWWPTPGTRRTGARNTAPRLVVDDGQLVPMAVPTPPTDWDFGIGQGIVAMEHAPMAEVITLHQHLAPRRMRSLLSANALRDLRNPETAAPRPVDALGRSAQRFTLQVLLGHAAGAHRATARGQDIYAVSAPLVVEAAARLLRGDQVRTGACTIGEAFDARALLRSLVASSALAVESTELR